MEPTDDVLRGLLAAAPEALFAVDTARKIAFVDDHAERLFGWDREDLVGQGDECLVPERFAPRHPALRAGYVAHPTTRPTGAGLEFPAAHRFGNLLGVILNYGTLIARRVGIGRQNSGEVAIDSTLGTGTIVTVVLPGGDGAASGDGRAAELARGGHERVLLVEGETALRVGTARILQVRGCEVLMAGDGLEALEVFEREGDRVDVVVTDVAIPRMRGDELARLIGGRRPGVPVIFTSGYDASGAPLPGRLLAKPVAQDVLLQAIGEVVDARV